MSSLKKIRNISLVALAVAVLHVFLIKSFSPTTEIDFGNDALTNKVLNLLNKDSLYKDRINDSDMYYGSIKGMVDSVDDPYTVFLPPEENKTSQENLAGEFGGVGISLGYKDGVLAVMSPLAKTPAERAGLKSGDLIVKIVDEANGVDVDTGDISITRAVELIRGRVGTKVVLEIYREGEDKPMEVELVRENIVVPSVEIEFMENEGKKIAWVSMYKFSERLYEEWDEMVKGTLGNNSDVLVLDLRNNPGGYLDASVRIASDFVSGGVIVKQKTGDGLVKNYEAEKGMSRLLNMKTVVLLNGGSASASEILAGALRQRANIKILGETSFGKGTVQSTENFSDGSGLHVTIAKWLLPDGGEIDGVGVEPDVEIEWSYDDKDTQKVFEEISKL